MPVTLQHIQSAQRRIAGSVVLTPCPYSLLLSRLCGCEITHDRNFGPADVASVRVFCILETRDNEHIKEVHDALKKAGIDAQPA